MLNRNTLQLFLGSLVLGLIAFLPGVVEAAITQQLDFGEENADVVQLQTYLAQDTTLYPEGLITGYFGPLTQAAVERFQCRHDIVCSGSPGTTGYGRVGPKTMIRLNAQIGAGVGGSTLDVHSPIMTAADVAVSNNAATISWQTNENANGRVMYATSFPFLYASASAVADADFDTSNTVTLSGLQNDQTYFYVRESMDLSGNITWTTAKSFKTAK